MKLRLRVSVVVLLWSCVSTALAHDPALDRPLPALGDYLLLGYEHILLGYDHLAFLVALCWSAQRWQSLGWAVTGFTLSHSVGLALNVLGVVAPPVRWVETLIALSVAYVAFESWRGRSSERRFWFSLGFGFVHGFGFAGALREIGVPSDRTPAALALFNLGVELGQLAVLLVFCYGLGWLRRSPRVWRGSTQLVHAVLMLLGLGWAAERALSNQPENVATAPQPTAADAASSPALLTTIRPAAPADSQRASAERLCELVARLPRERRAQCEGGPVGATVERACVRSVLAALSRGGLVLSEPALARCATVQHAYYADCTRASTPADRCGDVLQAQRDAGETCGSSLECRSGLQCDGVGPFDLGVCSEPKPAGRPCGRAIDPLASYTPAAAVSHPECSGSCRNGFCR
ncbi:MAG: HupE/UreJ family protein [Polyangiales bacterium]